MTSSPRLTVRRAALIAFCCACGLAGAQFSALQAADSPKPPAAAAKALPLTSTIEKVPGGENGPYVLKLKNTSTTALKLNTKVLLAVAFHADNKARKLGVHTIEPGQVWSIPDLAVADKVVVDCEGYAVLTIEIPAAKTP